jgi:hypothetical protein
MVVRLIPNVRAISVSDVALVLKRKMPPTGAAFQSKVNGFSDPGFYPSVSTLISNAEAIPDCPNFSFARWGVFSRSGFYRLRKTEEGMHTCYPCLVRLKGRVNVWDMGWLVD